MFKKQQVAVVFINGQSNAHAHHQYLKEEERVTKPMRNVFSLDRNPNQSFDITDVVWSGFTTEGKNLGETQDHTASLAYHLAKRWQGAIDRGVELPDLYIVQISIGSQGIINGMWNRDKEEILRPGPLGTVDIALFPLALKINRLVLSNLKTAGKEPVVIGWHWIGSEQEIHNKVYEREDAQQRYDYFFDTMMDSMGGSVPLYLYKIYTQKVCDRINLPAEATEEVNRLLLSQCDRFKDVRVIEAEQCPSWDRDAVHLGIFAEDDGHYLAEVQSWFAETFFTDVWKKFVGRKENNE